MAYKKYNKTILKDAKAPEKVIMDILKEGSKIQPEIQEIIKEKFNESKLSRMGLWKILDRLEKQGEIKSKFIGGIKLYEIVYNKSKLLAEITGIDFALHFKQMFIDKPELMKEFGLARKTKNNPEALMRFFGFYVLSTLVISHVINNKQRSSWLAAALDLEKSLSLSTFFEEFTENNDKTIKEIAITLKENYKKNFAYMTETALEALYRSMKIEKALFPENKIKSH